jgi:hypothetical protein
MLETGRCVESSLPQRRSESDASAASACTPNMLNIG